MGFLKFVIPFVGGALTAAAVNAAVQKKKEDQTRTETEVDAEFVEVKDEENKEDLN